MELLFLSQNILRIVQGVLATFQIAFIAILFSCLFGFILGYLMTLCSRIATLPLFVFAFGTTLQAVCVGGTESSK